MTSPLTNDGSDAVNVQITLPIKSPAFVRALKVVNTLKKSGFEAWIIGGAVRDMIMGITPVDYDIATSATPSDVQGLFQHTIPVGAQFGVIIVRISGMEFEVATLRADSSYSDGRRPDGVRFTDLKEDVLRRDFTMNGLALDPHTGIVTDLVGGIPDINAGVIRAIGKPVKRFEEDHLRPLRAVRFAAVTGFSIEKDTLNAIKQHAALVRQVSVERISEELRKLFEARDPVTGFRLADETGLLDVIIPELFDIKDIPFTAAVIDRLKGTGANLMWAAVLFPLGPERAAAVLRRLKRSNQQIASVYSIISCATEAERLPYDDVAAEKRLVRLPDFADGVNLLDARLKAAEKSTAPVEVARTRLLSWTAQDLHPQPVVSGNDVIAAGIPRGPRIASTLTMIEDEQLRGKITTHTEAVEFISKVAGETEN